MDRSLSSLSGVNSIDDLKTVIDEASREVVEAIQSAVTEFQDV